MHWRFVGIAKPSVIITRRHLSEDLGSPSLMEEMMAPSHFLRFLFSLPVRRDVDWKPPCRTRRAELEDSSEHDLSDSEPPEDAELEAKFSNTFFKSETILEVARRLL